MAIHPIEFRYGTPEMKKVWEAENKLQKMLEVEAALAEAEAQMGLVPESRAGPATGAAPSPSTSPGSSSTGSTSSTTGCSSPPTPATPAS